MSNTDLTTRDESLGYLSDETMGKVKRNAELFLKSGLLPAKFKSVEQVVVAASYGYQLGLSFQTAVQEIHVINGTPCLSSKMQVGLIRAKIKGVKYRFLEQNKERCVIEYQRPGDEEPTRVSYEWSEVPEMLRSKANWQNFRTDMLTARCESRANRMGFSDILAGFGYDPLELIEAQEVTEETHAAAKEPEKAVVHQGIPKKGAKPPEAPAPEAVIVDAQPITQEPGPRTPPAKPEEEENPIDQESIDALVSTMALFTEVNQIERAYDKFRAVHAKDPATLMAAYEAQQLCLAKLKEAKA